MKKLTIILVLLFVIIFVVDSFNEVKTEVELVVQRNELMEKYEKYGDPRIVNKKISNYNSLKTRGSTVKELIALVENLNVQDEFPIIVYAGGEFIGTKAGLPFEWRAAEGPTISAVGTTPSSDIIMDRGYYEVQIYDELENDGYLDTIHIKAY